MATFASGLMSRSRRMPLALAVIAAALLAGCGGAASPARTSTPAASAIILGASATTTGPQRPSAPPGSGITPASASQPSGPPTGTGPPTAAPVAPGAGALPQTRALPSTDSAAFRHAMQDLWLAVTTGQPGLALPAYFPLAAYRQLKAIAYPAADWHDRLWYDFTLDVAAAHRVVSPDARLVRVIVASYDAAWIYPGVCANSIGYWHVDGARVVYRQRGQERSFGIASLISWRGVWYVVHFGAVLRSVVTGIVDQPAIGPGVPGPPGGCLPRDWDAIGHSRCLRPRIARIGSGRPVLSRSIAHTVRS